MARPVSHADEGVDLFKTVVIALGLGFAAIVFVVFIVIGIIAAIVGFGP